MNGKRNSFFASVFQARFVPAPAALIMPIFAPGTPSRRLLIGRFWPWVKPVFSAPARKRRWVRGLHGGFYQKKQLSTLVIFRRFESKCTTRCEGQTVFAPLIGS
jgi:hypothetical protein